MPAIIKKVELNGSNVSIEGNAVSGLPVSGSGFVVVAPGQHEFIAVPEDATWVKFSGTGNFWVFYDGNGGGGIPPAGTNVPAELPIEVNPGLRKFDHLVSAEWWSNSFTIESLDAANDLVIGFTFY
jgi:hypothetical protein